MYNMTEQEEAKCNKCDEVFPCTTDFFYTTKGKLKTSICKECKKIQSREYRKTYVTKKDTGTYVTKKDTRTYEDRKEYKKQYYENNKEKFNTVKTKEYRREYYKQYRLKKKALLSVQE